MTKHRQMRILFRLVDQGVYPHSGGNESSLRIGMYLHQMLTDREAGVLCPPPFLLLGNHRKIDRHHNERNVQNSRPIVEDRMREVKQKQLLGW